MGCSYLESGRCDVRMMNRAYGGFMSKAFALLSACHSEDRNARNFGIA